MHILGLRLLLRGRAFHTGHYPEIRFLTPHYIATMIKLTGYCLAAYSLLSTSTALAGEVEIFLTDMLDNTQSGYCIDIARAQGAKANPDDGLQGHTCYSPKGELMVDQIFDSEKFADGILYMPNFDVCAEVTSVSAGSAIGLATCDDSPEQSFQFSGTGTIVPSTATDMCLTVAEETRTGRSNVNQIKLLTLEACTDDTNNYQVWATRSSL